jgi:hypothetical protein
MLRRRGATSLLSRLEMRQVACEGYTPGRRDVVRHGCRTDADRASGNRHRA